jgi:glycosyltransferase involved in cell wall biosynthesis
MKKLELLLFPIGSFRRKATKRILVLLHLRSYALATYYNTWFDQQAQNIPLGKVEDIPGKPLISVVVPVFNTPKAHYYEMLYSVISQAYDNWELIIVNASSDEKASKYIKAGSTVDNRIKIINANNEGISANTNKAIAAASGEFITFMDHDDTIDPFALSEVALAITRHQADLIYTDEDKITEDGGTHFDPHFKPDWSPDLITHVNYINHLLTVRKKVLEKAGLLNPDRDGAQDYDLLLRILDTDPVVYHIPKILYHWRAARTSTAQDFSSKKHITDAGVKALREHFGRKKIAVKVKSKDDRPGFYQLRFKPQDNLSLIILPFASDALLRLYVEILLKATSLAGTNVELFLPEGTSPRFKMAGGKITVLPANPEFLKTAVSQASNNQLIIISKILLPAEKDWLKTISGLMRLGHVGAVAPLVVRDGWAIDDCGLVNYSEGGLKPIFKNHARLNHQTFFGNTDWVRNVDALSGGVILTAKDLLENFLKSTERSVDYETIFKSYTLGLKQINKYNVIFPDVIFDNHSIRLKPATEGQSHFNPNLYSAGDTYEIYTPESSAINILLRIQESQEGKI